MMSLVFIVLCMLAALWEGGLGAGLVPFGPDFLPLVGLAVIGVWYVPVTIYTSSILVSAVVIDMMQGLDNLPQLRLSLIIVLGMLALYFRNSHLPEQAVIRRQVLLGLSLILLIRIFNINQFGPKVVGVYIAFGALTLVIWRTILYSSFFDWVDTYTRSTIRR